VTEDERGTRRLALFDQLLALVPAGSCVDLGAGHGKFSMRASAAGWDVTAVDVRLERFEGDGHIKFVEADVRSYDPTGFDLVLCLGLFYHLTLENQVDFLRRIDGTPLMLDTHVATGLYDSRMAISDPVNIGGYAGVHYQEGDQTDPRSSWGNDSSFWHTPDSLMRLLADTGFPVVLSADPWVAPDRRFFLALPNGWVPATAGGRGQLNQLTRTIRRRLARKLH
jgi:SAM-dependent methyltransferase